MDRPEQLIDSLTLGHAIAHKENAGHRFADIQAVIYKVRHRVTVVGQEDPIIACRPGEDRGIRRSGKICVLNAYDVQLRHAAQKPAHDIAVEVLVTGELDHRAAPSP
jgi:hypothetical protein